jgi:hypothetical protein
MEGLRLLCLGLLLALLTGGAGAQPAFTLERLDGMPAGATLADARARTPQQLQPVDAGHLRQPADAELWLRLRFDAASAAEEPWVLSLQGLRYSRVTLYGPDGHRPVTRALSADADPRFSRLALSFLLPARLQAGETWYLRLHRHGVSSRAIPASLRLEPLAQVNEDGLRHARIVMASVGALLAQAAALLLLWWRRREPVLAHAALTWGSAAFYIAFFFGEGFAMAPLMESSAWSFSAYVVPGALSAGASQLMYLHAMDTARHAPRLALAMRGFALYFFLAAAVGLPASSEMRGGLTGLTNLFILPGSLATLAAVGWAMRAGVPGSGLLLASWFIGATPLIWRALTLLAGQEAQGSALYYATPVALAIAGAVSIAAILERGSKRRTLAAARSAAGTPPPLRPPGTRLADALQRTGAAAARTGQPVAVIVMRLHRPADTAPQAPAWHWPVAFDIVRARLQHDVRDDAEIVAGDDGEVVALLPGADGIAAEAIARRWIAGLRAHPLRIEGQRVVELDPDAGVAWARSTETPDAGLVQQARAALAMSAADPARGIVSLAA